MSSTIRAPRPGKGRHSRTKRSPSPTADGGDRPGGDPEALRPTTAAACATPCDPSTSSSLTSVTPGYEQYQKSLLEVPWRHAEYGEASSDDLSSEWDSDVPEPPPNQKVNDGILVDECYAIKLHTSGVPKWFENGEQSQIYRKMTVGTCYDEFCNYVR